MASEYLKNNRFLAFQLRGQKFQQQFQFIHYTIAYVEIKN